MSTRFHKTAGRCRPFNVAATGEIPMQSESVYRIIDVVGVSETSWEDAGRKAVETAASSLRDLRVAEVTKMDVKVDNGKVTAFRTRVALSFKYETE
jgi:dodecin